MIITEIPKAILVTLRLTIGFEKFIAEFFNNFFVIYRSNLIIADKSGRRWNSKKFYKKINQLAKVIIHAGGNSLPALIGVCEIENEKVLQELIYHSPLEHSNYKYLHYNSEDRRGIDVGLLYQPDLFLPLYSESISVLFPNDSIKRTRDILYAKGIFMQIDTLHVFVNHWPSRYSGYMQTSGYRNIVAKKLKFKIDSIFDKNDKSLIVVMGDLNDGPEDESLQDVLHALLSYDVNVFDSSLYNLTAISNPKGGTLKHQGKWQIFDHIIVNGVMLNHESNLFVSGKAEIFKPEYLLEEDSKFLGMKPFRTYIGFNYNSGFSDHLPVLIRIEKRIPK